MSALITGLIDKRDTFEIVRDQIAAVLAIEVAEQQALAVIATEDPDQWKLRVFLERSNPWEQFAGSTPDPSPLVNVWYSGSTFDKGASNTIERQKADGTFNIDCYGYARSEDDGATGHLPGDREAALAVHRAVRLVRNILLAAPYTYLGLRGTVWRRWPQSVTVFQPEQTPGVLVPNVVGARLAFQVEFSEFAPQIDEEILELASVQVLRTEDGEIVLEADYDYTA